MEAAEAYQASDRYQADLAQSRDSSLDSVVQRQAALALDRGIVPARAKIDATWLISLIGAAFLYGVNMLAASCLWRASPETPAERERRIKAEEKAQRRADRRRKDMLELAKLQAETGAQRPTWLRAIFNGGRKAA